MPVAVAVVVMPRNGTLEFKVDADSDALAKERNVEGYDSIQVVDQGIVNVDQAATFVTFYACAAAALVEQHMELVEERRTAHVRPCETVATVTEGDVLK